MLRLGMMVCALALLGCDPPEGTSDAGMDAPFAGDTGDAPHETVMVLGTCTYVDYGSTCSASCDLPPDVPIYFLITWSEPYCCGFPTRNQEPHYDCRCIDGEVRCADFGTDAYDTPRSTCEGCPGTGSAITIDAGPLLSEGDAGT